jgi:glutathione-regulated potassium-efflux system ancillary protein KefG
LYPDFNINVAAEKTALAENDLIIWQHPLYWYSCPPLLKQWIDMVLEFGWAYGPGGNALEGKYFLQVVSSGGSRAVYSPEGRNRFTINTFLTPFNQTVRLCKAHYLPPFAVQGTHRLEAVERQNYTENLQSALHALQQNIPLEELKSYDLMNDWMNSTSKPKQ